MAMYEGTYLLWNDASVSAAMQVHRGTALGFYNWGIYLGYSTAFAFNFILKALDWHWVFIIASLPGFAVAIIHLLTVREPRRKQQEVCCWEQLFPALDYAMNMYMYDKELRPAICVACA